MPKRKEREPSSSDKATAVVADKSLADSVGPSSGKRARRDPSAPEAQVEDTERSITASKAKASISKRPTLAGKQRRLGTSATASTSKVNRISGSTRRNVTLSGSKVNFGLGTGGFEGVEKAPAGTATGTKEEELWVTRKAGFAFLLKRAIGAFTHRGCSRLTLRGMGAAIPTVLTLALAVPDQLPCGPEAVDSQVETGSADCYDEILPEDEQGEEDGEQDPQYQTRVKSTITVHLSLKQPISQPKQKVKQSG